MPSHKVWPSLHQFPQTQLLSSIMWRPPIPNFTQISQFIYEFKQSVTDTAKRTTWQLVCGISIPNLMKI